MTSTFLKRAIIMGLAGIAAIIVLYSTGIANSCQIRQMEVVNELKEFHETLDPQFCDELVNKIEELNDQCSTEIETIDCG